jgi:N-acetylgalactosamine kinase
MNEMMRRPDGSLPGRGGHERGARLLAAFRHRFGCTPTAITCAPGRVNLLGEHTDYNGLPVLPMAIDRNVLVAGARRPDPRVELDNVDARFPPRQYALGTEIEPFAAGDWGNYSKAAAQALARACDGVRHGARLLVDGNIPSGAGLSSSSALVVANALALLAANEVEVPYRTLAELLPIAERYVGTLSGGMDQATSLLAASGHALRIDFFPLRVRTVPLPAGHSVVVCHSLVSAEKAGAAKRNYNLRVIECRLACRVLERALGTSVPRGLHTLGDLATWFPGRPLLDFVAHCSATLPDRALRLAEIAAIIGTRPERLRAECEIGESLGDRFALLPRLRHVLSEAERVMQAEKVLLAGDAVAFGRLMDASHASCRDDYEISCAALEDLVRLAKEAGALGARLTGAGFGGCTVNLVRDDAVGAFLERIDRYFYAGRLEPAARVSLYRFVFQPQSGAHVVRYEQA